MLLMFCYVKINMLKHVEKRKNTISRTVQFIYSSEPFGTVLNYI